MRPTLLDLLPEVLRAHQVPDPREPNGFRSDPANLLKAFEKVLLGRPDGGAEPALGPALGRGLGLEQVLDDLHRCFTPGTNAKDGTPDEFLPWLSQWVAVSLRTDISANLAENNALRRQFIAQVADIYRWRGTKLGLKRLLGIFTGRPDSTITIVESTDRPFHFAVTLDLTDKMLGRDQAEIERLWELADAVIRKEKPAETWFTLTPDFPSFRLGELPASEPLRAQVGGIAGATFIGNTRLG